MKPERTPADNAKAQQHNTLADIVAASERLRTEQGLPPNAPHLALTPDRQAVCGELFRHYFTVSTAAEPDAIFAAVREARLYLSDLLPLAGFVTR